MNDGELQFKTVSTFLKTPEDKLNSYIFILRDYSQRKSQVAFDSSIVPSSRQSFVCFGLVHGFLFFVCFFFLLDLKLSR